MVGRTSLPFVFFSSGRETAWLETWHSSVWRKLLNGSSHVLPRRAAFLTTAVVEKLRSAQRKLRGAMAASALIAAKRSLDLGGSARFTFLSLNAARVCSSVCSSRFLYQRPHGTDARPLSSLECSTFAAVTFGCSVHGRAARCSRAEEALTFRGRR